MWKISFRRRYAQTIRDGASSNCKVIFSHFILNIKNELFHIWNLHKNYMLNNIFFKYPLLSKKMAKNRFFKVRFFMKPIWRYSFLLFYSQNPPKKFNYRMASSRAKTRSTQSQTCMKYRCFIIFIKRYSDVNTGDLNTLHKKCQNKVDFLDIIFNFSKMVCVLPSTLCMTG